MGSAAEGPVPPAADPGSDAQERLTRRRRRLRKVAVVVVVALIATGGIGWATNGFSLSARQLLNSLGPQCPPTVHLNGSGSTFIGPLMQTWVGAYAGAAATRMQGCLVVLPTYNASGAAGALGTMTVGGTEFVATEEPLSAAREAALPSPTLTLPLAVSAVAVAYHVPGVPAGLNLTGAILAGIYLGTITAWNDPSIAAANPGVSLPSGLAITVIHQANGSSTNYVFTGFLSLSNATWASRLGQGSSLAWPVGSPADGDPGAAALVESTPGAIAYLGLGSALAYGLSCARILNPSGYYVAPSATSVNEAALASTATLPLGNQSWWNVSLLDEPGNDSYPITTFTYAIVYADLGVSYEPTLTLSTAQWLAAFLYWMSVAGQPYGTTLGYAPFSKTVTNANQQIVELLKYDGSPALGDVDYDGD